MKKAMFKIIVLLAVIVLTFNFSACSRRGNRADVPTLVWWLIGTQPHDLSRAVKIMSDYTEAKIGVRFEIRMAGWGDTARLQTVVNSGEHFDIMFITDENYNNFVNLGAFAGIEELIRTEAPGLLEIIPPLVWEGTRIRGEIYAVPTYKDSATTLFHIWNEAFVKKYNLDITDTSLAGLDRNLRAVKKGEGRRFYPMLMARSTSNFLFNIFDSLAAGLQPLGVRMDDPYLRVVNTLEDPDVIKGFQYFHRWYRDGIINPDANILLEAPRQKTFFIAQGWPSAARLWAALEGVESYLVQPCWGPFFTSDSIQGSMNAISANSRHKAEALRLLELANTDRKFRDMLAFGLEGIHFEYTSPTTIRRLNDNWTLAAYQQATFFILSEPDDQAGGWDEVRKLNEMATPSPLLGFVLNIENIMNEIIACRIVWEKYNADLNAGASNPDVILPVAIADLRANGLDRIIEEAQRQLDKFLGR